MSAEILRAKVVGILDNQRIIINAGMEQGIKAGDSFFLYEDGDEITDPENNEIAVTEQKIVWKEITPEVKKAMNLKKKQ